MDREVGGEDFRNHQTKNYTLYILGYLDICWFVCMLKIQLFLIILSKKRDKKVPIPPTHTHLSTRAEPSPGSYVLVMNALMISRVISAISHICFTIESPQKCFMHV